MYTLESPSPNDGFCQVWLQLAKCVGRKRFLNAFFLFHYNFPLKKWVTLGFCTKSEQTWIPFTKESCLPSLIKFGQVVLEKKTEILKVYRQMDKQQATEKKLTSVQVSLNLYIYIYMEIVYISIYIFQESVIGYLLANLYKHQPGIFVIGWASGRWNIFLTFRKRYVVMEYVILILEYFYIITQKQYSQPCFRWKAL